MSQANTFMGIVTMIREYAQYYGATAKQAMQQLLQTAATYQASIKNTIAQMLYWIQLNVPYYAQVSRAFVVDNLSSFINYLKSRPQYLKETFIWAYQNTVWAVNISLEYTLAAAKFCWYYFVLGCRLGYRFIIQLPTHLAYVFSQLAHFARFLNNQLMRLLLLSFDLMEFLIRNLYQYSLKCLQTAWQVLTKIPAFIRTLATQLKFALTNILHETWRALKYLPTLLNKIYHVFVNSLKIFLEFVQKSVAAFANWLWQVIQSVPTFLKKVALVVSELITHLFHFIKNQIYAIAKLAWDLLKMLPQWLGQQLQHFKNICYRLMTAFQQGLRALLKTTWQMIQNIPNWVIQTYHFFKQWTLKLLSFLLETAKIALQHAWRFVQALPMQIYNGLNFIGQQLLRVAKAIQNGLQQFAQATWELIQKIPTVLKAIQNVTTQFAKQLYTIAKWIIQTLTAKAMVFVGTWYGVHLALVDLTGDLLNHAMMRLFGSHFATFAWFEPTKMLLAGLLATYTAYLAVKYTYAGISLLVGMTIAQFRQQPSPPELTEDLDHPQVAQTNEWDADPRPTLLNQYTVQQGLEPQEPAVNDEWINNPNAAVHPRRSGM